MKKKYFYLSGILTISLILVGSLASLYQFGRVCFHPLGQVDGKSHKYGLVMCFKGENISEKINDLTVLNNDAASMVSLLNSTKNIDDFIAEGKFDQGAIDSSQLRNHVSAINKMWMDSGNKEILFALNFHPVKKYFIQAIYQGKNLILQVQLKTNSSGEDELVLAPDDSEASKLIARWQALVGETINENDITLNFYQRLKLFVTYDKFCRDEGYCLFYRRFVVDGEVHSQRGNSVWEKFKSQISGGSSKSIALAMDSRSQRNIELNVKSDDVSQRTQAILSWLTTLTPVAYLYGDNFIAVFIGKGEEGMSNRQIYLNAASAPIFFVKKKGSNGYIAVGLNTVNYFKNFITKADFINGGDLN